MDFYIYYHVQQAKAATLREYVKTMQQELMTTYSVHAALKRRPDAINDQQTWMEIYLDVPNNFDDALQRAVQKFGLGEFIEGMRHVERFVGFELGDPN